eukprot:6489016-Amphidinium_carterae.1
MSTRSLVPYSIEKSERCDTVCIMGVTCCFAHDRPNALDVSHDLVPPSLPCRGEIFATNSIGNVGCRGDPLEPWSEAKLRTHDPI